MPLHLRIENETSLPDGGPISYSMQSSRGGINIGRDQYLDWVLPDPTRFVSGTHCEIRYRSGQFWIHDVSTNGTFLNGSEYRLAGPHALRSGDRIEIGRYIVAVEIEGEPNQEPVRDLAAINSQLPPDGPMVWNMPGQDAPEPIDPRELDHRRNARSLNGGSFLDWMADLPSVVPAPAAAPPPPPPAAARAPARPPASDQWDQAPGLWDTPAPMSPPQAPPAAAPPPVASWDPIPFEPPAAPPRLPTASLPESLAAFEPPPRPADFAPPPAASTPQWDLPPVTPPQAPAAWPEPAAPAPQQQPAPPAYAAPPPVSPPPMASPVAASAPYVRGEPGGQDFIARFARGARLPRDAFRNMDQGDFAELLGELMVVTVENLRQLQLARAQFKGKIRSSNHTMIGEQDINPLRFLPSADAVMRVMFGPPQAGYLDARRSIDKAFDDVKQHQIATVGALQNAVQQALRAVSPKAIEAEVPGEKGVGNLLGTRKARLWEKYCELWKAEFGDDEEAAMASFLRLFAESYDGRK